MRKSSAVTRVHHWSIGHVDPSAESTAHWLLIINNKGNAAQPHPQFAAALSIITGANPSDYNFATPSTLENESRPGPGSLTAPIYQLGHLTCSPARSPAHRSRRLLFYHQMTRLLVRCDYSLCIEVFLPAPNLLTSSSDFSHSVPAISKMRTTPQSGLNIFGTVRLLQIYNTNTVLPRHRTR